MINIVIPFHLRGIDGVVSVDYRANTDSSQWGFDWLHLPFDHKLTQGFPVFRASVEYKAAGYQAFMGWIQIVTVHDFDTGNVNISIDQAPIFWGADSPFCDFGYKPTLFDAPGPNPPRSNESWTAHSFLVYCSDVARTRKVHFLIALQWGYVLEHGKVRISDLLIGSKEDWDSHVSFIINKYPNRSFV